MGDLKTDAGADLSVLVDGTAAPRKSDRFTASS